MNLLDFYEACREIVANENSLVNERMSWMLVTQGLLFTALGLIANAARENGRWDALAKRAAWIIPGLGIVTSAATCLGVAGALTAVRRASATWSSHAASAVMAPGKEIAPADFPPLDNGLRGSGTIAAVVLCAAVFAIWVYLFWTRKNWAAQEVRGRVSANRKKGTAA